MCTAEGSKWGCSPEDPEDENEFMRRDYTAIYSLLIKPWMRRDTWTMHIPVSGSTLLAENGLNLSRVVQDSDFPKPPSPENLHVLHGCATGRKDNTLIYAARYSYSDHKGQRAFLSSVQPEDLEGFTIHFFGGNLYEVEDELTKLAISRNISISLHGYVPQEELLQYICRARGMVLFSRGDANPRVAYEGFPAGNPVYLSAEVSIPESVKQLDFVFFDTQKHLGGPEQQLPGFHKFMETLKGSSSSYHLNIRREAMVLLHHDSVYSSICVELGLCEEKMEPHSQL
eukprot:CAMPEP_0117674238 /NCGR_PEP_ID=MMETSP0804-20121206/14922_1 /TAXON_ID=1074897 /ORGANISM="Tetraselmis astigmatica, Strain CCMP880" /LENGTH=284 /DNA_ID=CAMNT_0005483075 /DNA_START=365 /DNA_END=1219 /DNA_ORIENTATION=-